MKPFIFISVLISLLSLGCDHEELVTGAEGSIVKSPINPVEIQGQINYAPLKAKIHVFDRNLIKVTSFESNEEGFYIVFLKPGIYTFIPDKNTPIMSPQLQSKLIEIESIEITKVDLNFDTGIR